MRWPEAHPVMLADSSIMRPAAILLPLTDEPEALAVGDPSALLLFMDSQDRLLAPIAVQRSRSALRALLAER